MHHIVQSNRLKQGRVIYKICNEWIYAVLIYLQKWTPDMTHISFLVLFSRTAPSLRVHGMMLIINRSFY